MPADSVRLESVRPRDIELLVLEEATVSPDVRSWLLERLALGADDASAIDARAVPAGGETETGTGTETGDSERPRHRSGVAVGLAVDGDRVRVGFAAALEPDATQSRPTGDHETVRTRGGRASDADRKWDERLLVALAPAATAETFADGSRVDETITLESLREHFATRGTDRGEYRAAVVEAAIDAGRRGDTGRDLVRGYRSVLAGRETELDFDLDVERPSADVPGDAATGDTATTVELESPSLASDHRLVHRLEGGSVDLLIPGAAPHLQSFAARYAGVIPPATNFLESDETLVLRRSAPPLESESGDSGADSDSSLEEAVDGALEPIADLVAIAERVRDRAGTE